MQRLLFGFAFTALLLSATRLRRRPRLCYLIKYGGDWMLWDAGLPKKYLASSVEEGSSTFKLDRTIVAQLADLGLRAYDIKYVAVSHAHFDHSGQVKDFPNATLIMQRSELVAMADTETATAKGIDALLFSSHINGNKRPCLH